MVVDGLGEHLTAWAEGLRVPVQDAMATMLRTITLYNFGPTGVARPTDWADLSVGYAATHHGGNRTPTLELTGALKVSIETELGNPDHSTVFTTNDYAAIHQWGLDNEQGFKMSARPFFPIEGSEDNFVLTPYAENEIRLAAEQAISEYLAR